ncbi:PAS domain-containing protein [uncultured Ruegeria sp.]|uniref:helix-turn-helix transcriptional regulator n=1 Tax=uncultured Ruegeria sp. TaxID=259304 RepID=UPI00260424AF|nr:PAS domain-containing protein [uncultured Ruegeria sp.]
MQDLRANAEALTRAIPMLFGNRVEVVLHDLDTDSIASIENPFSQRKPGDPSNMHETEFRPGETVIGPYEKVNWDGSILRSISVVLRDEAGIARLVLCINHDQADLQQLSQLVRNLQPAQVASAQPDSLFRNDWHERLNVFVSDWCAHRNTRVDSLDREDRRALVNALETSNALAERNAAAYVARLLGVSRATVYNDLRAVAK